MKNDSIKQIRKTRVLLAPMSGITDIPFRLMCRKFGCKFTFTEMIDINGILYNSRKTFSMMDTVPEDAPVAIQLVGKDADDFLKVGGICEERGFKLLDINAGCPARKVVKCGKGAALMKDVKRLTLIIEKLTQNLKIPVMVKIRSGWDKEHINCVKVAKAVEKVGARALAVHPRTRDQMYKGKADHSLTKKVKEAVKIPVIASGDVFSTDDVKKLFKETKCDAVFIARGALGKPWIFRNINESLKRKEDFYDPSFGELKKIVTEHYALSLKYFNDVITRKKMYKHFMWYFKKYKNKNDIMKEYQKAEGLKAFKSFMKRLKCDGKDLYV